MKANMERRHNWKSGLGQKARQRIAKRQELLIELELIREEIAAVTFDAETYDRLKLRQREIIAQLATL